MNLPSSPKTALVHHWLVTRRGGERVLAAIAELFPSADIFTLVANREKMGQYFPGHRIHTSFLQYLPRATRWYPHYLPLFPLATELLDLRGYELVITSDAATLKGVRTDPGAIHICYCHTPMRYIWSGYETYFRSAGPLTRLVMPSMARWLRRWDCEAAQRVTHFVANSRTVAERIRCYYGRGSTVIYPPVDTEGFVPGSSLVGREDFFLVVSQLVPYKRVDLAVDAFNRCGRRLVVIGEGSERKKLERSARSNIRFLGAQTTEIVRQSMQRARALIFPGEEDFGIVMAETQACGTPVIAFGRGGAIEIVADGVTGVLFAEQSAESLANALERFMGIQFNPLTIRSRTSGFSRRRFQRELAAFVEESLVLRARGLPKTSMPVEECPLAVRVES